MDSRTLKKIDDIVKEAISIGASPGCQVLVARNGKVVWHQAYGYHSYLKRQQVRLTDLADEKIRTVLTHAPGNGVAIGGLKVITESGWFAVCPSGTEGIYKVYAENFRGEDHLFKDTRIL